MSVLLGNRRRDARVASRRGWRPIAFSIACLTLWEAVTRLGLVDTSAIPPATTTILRAWGVVLDPAFGGIVGDTLLQWASGLSLAVLAGVLGGVVIAASDRGHTYLLSTIDFLRSVPPVALLPLFVLILGTGVEMTTVLVGAAAVWPVLLQTIAGVRSTETVLRETVAVFKVGPANRLVYVLAPSALPYLASGLRVSATIAIFVTFTAGMVAGAPGLGLLIVQSQVNGDASLMYAAVLFSGVLGLLVNLGCALLERRVLAWHPSDSGGPA